MKRIWIYLVNTFDVNTKNSYRKMLRIANDHDARLEAASKDDPAIMAIYTVFHAALLVFRTLMVQWVSGKGIGKRNTQSWTELLDEMSAKWINVWEGLVFGVYPKGTPEATAIFPNNKFPFQNAIYDERMIAVEALQLTLQGYETLTVVEKDVEAKLALLKEARQVQQEQFGKTGFSSGKVEAQRVVLANLLDDDLCDLKKLYRSNPGMVEKFFDLSLLRKPANDTEAIFQHSGTVEAGATTAVPVPAKLTMSANAVCTFANKSNLAELAFFFSANASAGDNPLKTTVLPNESAEGTAAESGWAPGTNYIIVKNPGSVTAEYELMVVEGV